MSRIREAILVSSRKNELRYISGLVPELSALGIEVSVVLVHFESHPAKSHLEVDDTMIAAIRARFPSVAVKLVKVGEDWSPAGEGQAVFISLDPPGTFASRLPSLKLPWIQVQHSDDLFMTNGLSSQRADGFLLMGESWISDRVRLDPNLSPLARASIDYVRSKPAAFPGHLGLNNGSSEKTNSLLGGANPNDLILLFDHAIAFRGRSPLRTLIKAVQVCSRYPSEIMGLRTTFKNLNRSLSREGFTVAIRPRLKGLQLPLGYPSGARRTELALLDDDPSDQILESNGIISFFPSLAIVEALYLGKPVLGIDWWRFISARSGIHSSPQMVMWAELQESSCPGFRVVGPSSDMTGLRPFFADKDVLGTFDMGGWISPAIRRREELARLLVEVASQK